MPDSGLAALVVAYGLNEHLHACLRSLVDRCPLLVIDNSSEDGVRELAEVCGARYEDARENGGFAAGVNRGLRLLHPYDLVLVVNPDAVIAARDVDLLIDAVEERVALVAPRLKSPDGTDQRVMWPLPSPGRAWKQALCGGDGGGGPQYAIGAVMLLSQAAIADVGGFDERFFLYAEETDWQKRALTRAWRIVHCDAATALHVGAGTSNDSSKRLALFHAGAETYIRKWHGSSGWQLFRTANIVRELIRLLARRGQSAETLSRLGLYLRGPRRVAGLDA